MTLPDVAPRVVEAPVEEGEVATDSPQAYVNMAVELASPSRAQQRHDWRMILRSMMRNAVLCQPDLFVPSLESAFINMAAIRRKEMKA